MYYLQPSDAVRIQVQQRVDHAAKKILPPLHGLVNLATDGPLARTRDLEELESTLGELQLALSQALPAKSAFSPTRNHQLRGSLSIGQPSGSLPPTANSNKRRAPLNLLPPSPEARQIRKFSSSVV